MSATRVYAGPAFTHTGEIYPVTCSVLVKVELEAFVMSEGDKREEWNGRGAS